MIQPEVKMLPVRFRLTQADRRDITLSISEFTTSSESASDSLVTSADCWIQGHWARVSNSEQNPSSSSFTSGCISASGCIIDLGNTHCMWLCAYIAKLTFKCSTLSKVASGWEVASASDQNVRTFRNAVSECFCQSRGVRTTFQR